MPASFAVRMATTVYRSEVCDGTRPVGVRVCMPNQLSMMGQNRDMDELSTSMSTWQPRYSVLTFFSMRPNTSFCSSVRSSFPRICPWLFGSGSRMLGSG